MRPLRFDVDEELYLWIKTTAAKERKSMKKLLIEALELLMKEKAEAARRSDSGT